MMEAAESDVQIILSIKEGKLLHFICVYFSCPFRKVTANPTV